MEGSKALLSRRDQNCVDHYMFIICGEDEEIGIELSCAHLNKSSSEDESVFTENRLAATNRDNRALDERHLQSSRSFSPAEDRLKKSRSNGSDDVDMPINSSKHVTKGFKRRTSESRDIVYDFGWFDVLIGIASIVVYFVDIITDVKLAVDYFLDSYWFYGGVTTALIVGPSLVTCCFGLHWYLIDYKTEKKVIRASKKKKKIVHHVTPSYVWFCRFFFTVLQFGPVLRTIEYLHYGCKSRSRKLDEKSRRRFHWWMLYEDVDNCLLRLFESFLESAPQLVWQLYITIITKPEDDVIGTTTRAVSLLSSWGSLAISLVAYHRSLRNSREDKYKMKFLSMPFYLIWRACETGARVLCIAMFASAFEYWVFGILLFHWVATSVWLMHQRTTFYNHRCLEKVFNIICGYVMLFCFLNLREGHTRYRFLIYYIVFYIENFFMLAFWFRFTPDLGAWFHIWGFIVVLIFFFLHIIFQLIYYSCFHPTNSIRYCLPCDKYTFYESVCYDVRPEVEDAVSSQNRHYTSKEMTAAHMSRFHDISVERSQNGEEGLEPKVSHHKRLYRQHSNMNKGGNHAGHHDVV